VDYLTVLRIASWASEPSLPAQKLIWEKLIGLLKQEAESWENSYAKLVLTKIAITRLHTFHD